MAQSTIQDILARKSILAPMLGTTDIPFRRICRELGAGLTTTEMVSSKGISGGIFDSFRSAVFDPSEAPVAIQLVAASEAYVTSAIRELRTLKPTLFDLNFGCPNDYICEAGAGATVLDDVPRLGRIVEAAVRASSIPVSVKIRAFGRRKNTDIRVVTRAVQDSGAAYLTVHGRGRFTAYSEPADWEPIALAKSVAVIPVVGNGDVFSARDARAMRRETGCDAVMVARGALGTPWIFRDITLDRDCGILDCAPDDAELLDLILRHATLLSREFGPIAGAPRIRKHVMWYTRLYDTQDTLRRIMFRRDDAAFILDEIKRFFDTAPRRMEADEPAFTAREALFRERVLYWTLAPVPA